MQKLCSFSGSGVQTLLRRELKPLFFNFTHPFYSTYDCTAKYLNANYIKNALEKNPQYQEK